MEVFEKHIHHQRAQLTVFIHHLFHGKLITNLNLQNVCTNLNTPLPPQTTQQFLLLYIIHRITIIVYAVDYGPKCSSLSCIYLPKFYLFSFLFHNDMIVENFEEVYS